MGKEVILITGGAGFIGSHLANEYVKRGNIVKVLDDFSNGNVNNIRSLLNYRNFKLIKGDVRDHELVQRITSDVDIIFHLAAQIHVDKSIIYPRQTFDTNTMGTLNILEASLKNDVKKVIYASSSEVYGTAQNGKIDEQHPLNPFSPYAASKAAADRLCFSYYKTFGLDVTVVRNFNIYGPKQKSTGYGAVIPIFIRRAIEGKNPIIYGDGLQTRDYMYIEDAVKAYDLVTSSSSVAGKAINFGTGRDISVCDLADIILELCNRQDLRPVHVAPRPGEVGRLCANITLARKILGFKPQYTLKEGLLKFIDWHLKYGYEEWTKQG